MTDEAQLPGKLQVAIQQVISEKEIFLFLLGLYNDKKKYSWNFSSEVIKGSEDVLPSELKEGKKIKIPVSLEKKDKIIHLILNDTDPPPIDKPPASWWLIIIIILVMAMLYLNGGY